MRTAACTIIEQNGLFLSVSRRNDNTKWGLPGGKTDNFETCHEAIVREVKEEVGLLSGLINYIPIFSSTSAGDHDFWVTTYVWVGGRVETAWLTPEEGLEFKWSTREELCEPDSSSPFAAYNRRAFAAYDEFKEHNDKA